MFRLYKRHRQKQDQDEELWVMDLIREAKEEQEKNPMTLEEMLKADEELARYGAKRAKELGLRPKDVNRIIYESRKRFA